MPASQVKVPNLGLGGIFQKKMAKHHDLWVLTRLNNREIIENELLEKSDGRASFHLP